MVLPISYYGIQNITIIIYIIIIIIHLLQCINDVISDIYIRILTALFEYVTEFAKRYLFTYKI